jgi:hypothetical protein
MSANLNSLKAEAGRGSGRSRASLIAALEANNCRKSSKEVVVASRDNSPSLFSRLFGQSSAQRKRPADEVRQQEVKVRSANRSNVSGGRDRILRAGAASTGIPTGAYRTFCVRTCDGYYFPMSPASGADDMQRDANNCQAACPGAETALYYHQDDQEDAEAMISRMDGRLYGQLKTAFAYREANTLSSDQCSCSLKQKLAALASSDKNTMTDPSSPLPANRPDPAADPETHANMDGELTADAMRQLLSSEGASIQAERRAVRVVGPAFLPDPAAATALPIPVPTAVR